MRVAFSGTHRTGKTTLIKAVHSRVSRYDFVEEPYRLLEEEGYEFSDPPSFNTRNAIARAASRNIGSFSVTSA